MTDDGNEQGKLRAILQGAIGARFEVGPLLGSGGFAHVFAAFDRTLERDVAIKVLRPEVASELVLERFFREAKMVAQLRHPNLIPVYDVDHRDGIAWLMMPLIEGQTLKEAITAGPIAMQEVRRILAEITKGLAVAHASGILHRDLKPANVMLDGEDVILMDFGIAKALEGTDESLTPSLALLGTPAYMSPEQATGEALDARSDFYSLGCIGFEMLSGHPPFVGRAPRELLIKHALDEPPELGKGNLARTIMRCLEKKPERRWQTAEALLESLAPSIHEPSQAGTGLLALTALLTAAAFIWNGIVEGGLRFTIVQAALLFPTVVAVFGTWSRINPRGRFRLGRPPSLGFELPQLEHGLYGGVIGGTLGSVVIGLVYLFQPDYPIPPTVLPQVLLIGGLSGAVLGGCIQVGSTWFLYRRKARRGPALVMNEITGGVIGGAVGGLLSGVVQGLVFIQKELPSVDGDLLFYGSTPIALCVVVAVLLSGYRDRKRDIPLAFLAATVLTVFVAVILVTLVPYGPITRTFFFDSPGPLRAATGGAIVGGLIGVMLGVQIGATLTFIRLWGKPVVRV